MPEWSNTNGNQNVPTLPIQSFYIPETYTLNTWSSNIWLFSTSSLPTLIPLSETLPSWSSNESYRVVTDLQSKTPSTYMDNTWLSPPWSFIDGSLPFLLATESLLPTWADYDSYPTITSDESMMKETYLSSDWDMERVWVIREGRTFPRHVNRVGFEGNLGEPLQHGKRYIMVEPHYDGTMNWDGVTWKYIQTFYSNPSPPLTGTAGTRVTYAVLPTEENQIWRDPTTGRDVPIKFIASAIRDPLGAGGFSKYTDETVRSDILNNSYSTLINFYFARLSDLPRLNYKLKIQTPTQLVEANTRFTLDSPITVSTNPATLELVSIPYVDLNSPLATPIHVSTPEGIKALMKYQEEKDYKLKGIDNG